MINSSWSSGSLGSSEVVGSFTPRSPGQNMVRAGEWVRDVLHGEVLEQLTPQEPGTQYCGLGDDDSVPELSGARPTLLVEVRQQERVQRHTVVQILDVSCAADSGPAWWKRSGLSTPLCLSR